MKIESSSVNMAAISTAQKISKSTEQLRVWSGNQPNTQSVPNQAPESSDAITQLTNLLKDATKNLQQTSMTSQTEEASAQVFEIPKEAEDKIRLLNKLLEALTGKKMRFNIPKKIILKNPGTPAIYSQPIPQQSSANKGWGIDYQKHEYIEESEAMHFNSGGTVTTSDGREINFEIDLNLSRSFVSEKFVSFKAGDALIDPLIINFEQSSAELTNTKFSFDLDNDGKQDNISFTKTGSGFLVFDKNKDGTINNGSELFGPTSGNGFIELASFDSDGNNWIDENDDIYDQLQIWTKDANGQDQLFAIGEKGIGAIYLGSVQSSFALKDQSNSTLGQIQQTGIFLRENGTAGTIQHVDISL